MEIESKKSPGTVNIRYIDEETLHNAEEISNINICSDGGVKNKKGGFGFVIAMEDKVVMESNHRIGETYNGPTSYRAEAIGVMCAIQTYNRIQKFYRHNNKWSNLKRIHVYCDNESVIKIIKQHRYRKLTSKTLYSAEMDIFNMIFKLLTLIPDKIMFYHVKGHQDRGQQPLSLPAYLNTIADDNATISLQSNRLPKK
jgi:RNase H